MASIDDVYNLCRDIFNNTDGIGSDITIVEEQTSDIQDKVTNDLIAPQALNNTPIGASGLTGEVLGTQLTSGDFNEQTGTFWFTLDLTQIPTNAQQQKGIYGPNVYYAGWFGLKSGGYYLPRVPVHFKSAAFQAESGIDGCYFTLYEGFQATLTAYQDSGGGPQTN